MLPAPAAILGAATGAAGAAGAAIGAAATGALTVLLGAACVLPIPFSSTVTS